MKNMLLIAGIATFSFATLLVWADRALINYFETPKETVVPVPAPIPTLHLPEVVISANRGLCSTTTRIP